MNKIYILLSDMGDTYYFSYPLRALNFAKKYLEKSLDKGDVLDSAITELMDSYKRNYEDFGVEGILEVFTAEIDREPQ